MEVFAKVVLISVEFNEQIFFTFVNASKLAHVRSDLLVAAKVINSINEVAELVLGCKVLVPIVIHLHDL